MKITPTQQYIILGFAIFLGVVFLYYQFLLKPINNKIVALQSTLDQKKQDLDKAKEIVAKYVEFKKREDSVQRELEWIQNRIPKTIDKAKLSEAIGLVQSKSGVFLTSFQFAAASAGKEAYSEVPATVKFNSDFAGLLGFLYQISVSNLIMTVHDLTVTPLAPAPNGPPVTLSAQMIVSGIEAK